MGGGNSGADEVLIAEGDVEGCDGAGDEEPSNDNAMSAVIKAKVFGAVEA